ncbi:MAG: radical SAM protein [bacterium]|nr:radical SAM protein [bacterium]
MPEKLPMQALSVELTPRCNQRCIYCYNAWREDNGEKIGEPDFSTLEKIIKRLLEQVSVPAVTLTGGEPFLRSDIFDIIDLINTSADEAPGGTAVNIISNGGTITAETAEKLSRRKVGYVQITLGGADAATHDNLCGTGTFEKAKQALHYLQEAGVRAGGSYLCTSLNNTQAGEVFEIFATLGVKQIAFNRFNPSGDQQRVAMKLMPTRTQVMEALEQANGKTGKYKLNVTNTMPIPPCVFDYNEYPHIKFGHCSAGDPRAQLAVGPDGNVKLCTLQKQTVGSVMETPLREILQGKGATGFRESIPEFCRGCPFAGICLGGCGAAAEWVYGSADQLDPFLAQHISPETL